MLTWQRKSEFPLVAKKYSCNWITQLAAPSSERRRSIVESSREAPCVARGVILIATGALPCHWLGWRRARITTPNVPRPSTASTV